MGGYKKTCSVSRSIACSFSFFGFYLPKSHPSSASASELDRCHHGCVSSPRERGIRGPSSELTLQVALHVPFKDLSTKWGVGTGCPVPCRRSKGTVLGHCHPTHQAAVLSSPSPPGRRAQRATPGGTIFLAGGHEEQWPRVVRIPGVS